MSKITAEHLARSAIVAPNLVLESLCVSSKSGQALLQLGLTVLVGDLGF